MTKREHERQRIAFGDFELDVDSRELYRGDLRLRLQEKPMRVLALLTERAGHVVTRDELRDYLWPADTHVDFERNLNTAVKKLRIALADSAETPRYVETIPKRGYRFLAAVHVAGQSQVAEASPTAVSAREQISEPTPAVTAPGGETWLAGFWRWVAVTPAAVVALLVGLTATSGGDARPSPVKSRQCPESVAVAVLPFQHEGRGAPHDLSAELNSEVPRLLVNATAGNVSVFAGRTVKEYECSKRDFRRMGRELGARYVMEGSVRQTNQGLRVTTQLFETKNGRLVAAESFDVPSAETSAHSQVAEMVASTVLRCVAPVQRVAS